MLSLDAVCLYKAYLFTDIIFHLVLHMYDLYKDIYSLLTNNSTLLRLQFKIPVEW